MDKLTTIIVALIVVVLSGIALVLWSSEDSDSVITTYEECVEAGYPIMESYPEQCAVPDGETFTRVLTEEEELNNQLADDAVVPENVEEADLLAVGNYSGSGTATRYFSEGVFMHEVVASLDPPAEGKFYEGWLVTPGATAFISTGELTSDGGSEYSLTYSSDIDYTDYVEVVITEETLANGLDNVPEAHVLEGSF